MIYDVNSELFLRFIRAKGDKSQYLYVLPKLIHICFYSLLKSMLTLMSNSGLNTNVKSNQSKGTSFSMPVQAQSA